MELQIDPEDKRLQVTEDDIKQFHEEGYFVLENIISEQDLTELRVECKKSLDLQVESMERVGAETLGLSHKGKRYSLPCRHEESPCLERFLFGDLMMEIVRPVLGPDAYLFLELFVIKWPRTGLQFAWHQDSDTSWAILINRMSVYGVRSMT